MNEDIDNFEAALEAEADRKLGLRVPRGARSVASLFYRDQVRYSEQVQRYFDVFGRENVHIIIYDDFRDDLGSVYRDTLKFLGVDEGFQPRFEVKNPNKVMRSRVLQRFLRSPQSSVAKIGRLILPLPFRRRVGRVIHRFNMRYVPRPPMDPELRLSLQAEFAPEVERLSEVLGRDLTHWSLPEQKPQEPKAEVSARLS